MEQTIAAISTSTMSSGGISIVRISGENAISVADTIFEAKNNKKLSKADSHGSSSWFPGSLSLYGFVPS